MTRLLKAREVADYCGGVGVSTIYYWAAMNAIPHIRFGERAIRFPEDALEAWLQAKVQGGNRMPDPAVR